jgi:hypothetical protein
MGLHEPRLRDLHRLLRYPPQPRYSHIEGPRKLVAFFFFPERRFPVCAQKHTKLPVAGPVADARLVGILHAGRRSRPRKHESELCTRGQPSGTSSLTSGIFVELILLIASSGRDEAAA